MAQDMMIRHITYLIFLAALCGAASRACAQSETCAGAYVVPPVPDSLTTSGARADYLALHYWDNFDFADTRLISAGDYAEQAFVDFVGLLPYVGNAAEAVGRLFGRAAVGRDMLYYFVSLGEKYLCDRGSPMRDEELYILMLRSLADNASLAEADRVGPRRRLELVMKNRVGDVAADFGYLCRDGTRGRLSDLHARYVVIYFNDPDCADCHSVRSRLAASDIVNASIGRGDVVLLSVCVVGATPQWEAASYPDNWVDAADEGRKVVGTPLYLLPSLPSLYLLDAGRRVVLKDTSVAEIEAMLSADGDV